MNALQTIVTNRIPFLLEGKLSFITLACPVLIDTETGSIFIDFDSNVNLLRNPEPCLSCYIPVIAQRLGISAFEFKWYGIDSFSSSLYKIEFSRIQPHFKVIEVFVAMGLSLVKVEGLSSMVEVLNSVLNRKHDQGY